MIQDEIHRQICKNLKKVDSWFAKVGTNVTCTVYSSFDVRDSGFKIAPVDANIFPAGFNNICQADKDLAHELLREYLVKRYPEAKKNVLLLTEEHTQNPYYWENVHTIFSLIERAGYSVCVAIPRPLSSPMEVQSINGHRFIIHGVEQTSSGLSVNGFEPELIINNNDFSSEYESWLRELKVPVDPPIQMGWYRRRKDQFFNEYNTLAREFCEVIDVPPIWMNIKTEVFKGFDIGSEESRNKLADRTDQFLASLQTSYKEHGIETQPFAFVKNNSGTYGLGILKANSGDEIRSWSYKSRKKMKAAKGGGGFSEVVIQEGIPTRFSHDGEAAEPALYLIGRKLAGGFLRTHTKKGVEDNLNSPGAVYKRLCVSDLRVDVSGCPMENVYGWAARIGALAIGREAKL